MDVLLQKRDGSILYGYRIIRPYQNTWALIGGRFLHGEKLSQAATRISDEYNIRFDELCLVGVFTTESEGRSDLIVAVAALNAYGDPIADGKEFSQMVWKRRPPTNLGSHYRRIVLRWKKVKSSSSFTKLNKIPANQ